MSATPISVNPRSAIRDRAARSSASAAARITSVRVAGSGSVRERVARLKSAKRSRSTTVRHARPAPRSRRVTRSTSAISDPAISSGGRGRRPSACWAPIERRRPVVRTRRGSRLWARAWTWRPLPRPRTRTNAASPAAAASPTVVIPTAWSLPVLTLPTPHSRSTGRGWRKASSSPTATSRSPSGLADALATLARCFVAAMPTVIGSPTWSRTSCRRLSAIWRGEPEMCSRPRTSRNASSIDSASTSGAVSSNTRNTARLAST